MDKQIRHYLKSKQLYYHHVVDGEAALSVRTYNTESSSSFDFWLSCDRIMSLVSYMASVFLIGLDNYYIF